MDVLVVSVSTMSGAFCRSLTGFGGSILFELVYNSCAQANVGGLGSAVLMVGLGCAFEIFTSTVPFLVVFPEAARQYRMLLGLTALSFPATLLGTMLLVKLNADSQTLADLRLGLNVLFAVMAMYKLTTELKPKKRNLTESLLPAQPVDPASLFRTLYRDMLALGFISGFLNGLIGLPGPAIMVYFASAMSSGSIGVSEGYAITQGAFMITTLQRAGALSVAPGVLPAFGARWLLFAAVPLPSLVTLALGFWVRRFVDPMVVLRGVLALLLLSSLVGTGALQGTRLGTLLLCCTIFWALWMKLSKSAFESRTSLRVNDPIAT